MAAAMERHEDVSQHEHEDTEQHNPNISAYAVDCLQSATGELPEHIGRFVPDFSESERVLRVRRLGDGMTEAMKLAKEFEKEIDDVDVDGSLDVLASILSPSKRNPAHAKVIQAVMMSGNEAEEKMPSPLPKIVDGHTPEDGTVKSRPRSIGTQGVCVIHVQSKIITHHLDMRGQERKGQE